GTWNGTFTLFGVNLVPAPGALALLGMAGLAGRRRRG
ncbi:MAG: PEP-CTERM sorting domain-containing protein, partial [Planctomycetia bacterium]|nr:PEP-CTERM sorting domain-containing protein [Planctomycetia bacterium]